MSRGDGAPATPQPSLLSIRGDTTLRIDIESHDGERVAGGVLIGVAGAFIAGSVIAFLAMDADVGVELGVLLGGMGVGLTLGMISAFALLFRFDEVKLEMEGPQAAL